MHATISICTTASGPLRRRRQKSRLRASNLKLIKQLTQKAKTNTESLFTPETDPSNSL